MGNERHDDKTTLCHDKSEYYQVNLEMEYNVIKKFCENTGTRFTQFIADILKKYGEEE